MDTILVHFPLPWLKSKEIVIPSDSQLPYTQPVPCKVPTELLETLLSCSGFVTDGANPEVVKSQVKKFTQACNNNDPNQSALSQLSLKQLPSTSFSGTKAVQLSRKQLASTSYNGEMGKVTVIPPADEPLEKVGEIVVKVEPETDETLAPSSDNEGVVLSDTAKKFVGPIGPIQDASAGKQGSASKTTTPQPVAPATVPVRQPTTLKPKGRLVPVSTNGHLVPVPTQGRLVPVTSNGCLVPVPTNGCLVPIPNNSRLVPVPNNSGLVPVPIGPFKPSTSQVIAISVGGTQNAPLQTPQKGSFPSPMLVYKGSAPPSQIVLGPDCTTLGSFNGAQSIGPSGVTKFGSPDGSLQKSGKRGRKRKSTEPKVVISEDSVGETECSVCLLIFGSKNELQFHQETAHPTKVNRRKSTPKSKSALENGDASKTFSPDEKPHINLDGSIASEENDDTCSICGQVFLPPELLHHVSSVHKIGGYPCPIPGCVKVYPKDFLLKTHILVQHSDTDGANTSSEFLCSICGHPCASAELLSQHKCDDSPVEDEQGEYTCALEACGKVFRHMIDLKHHMQTHLTKKSYICHWPGCGRSFKRKEPLHEHIQVHLGRKVFFCTYCTYTADSPDNLKDHIARVHHGERPISCEWPGCGKKFKFKKALVVHMRIHNDEKPVSCKLCSYRCRQKSSLNWHMKSQHQMEIAKTRVEGAANVQGTVSSMDASSQDLLAKSEQNDTVAAKRKRPRSSLDTSKVESVADVMGAVSSSDTSSQDLLEKTEQNDTVATEGMEH